MDSIYSVWNKWKEGHNEKYINFSAAAAVAAAAAATVEYGMRTE